MRYFLTPFRSAAAFVIAVTFTCTANAMLVQEIYDDFTLQYDDAVMTLFGSPPAGGNTVFFLPTQFEAFYQRTIPSIPPGNCR